MKTRKLIVILLAFIFSCQEVFSQTDSLTVNQDSSSANADVFSMSIEDLMDVKVTTASKNAERIQDAPAAMSVMTAKEIEGFGALTLAE